MSVATPMARTQSIAFLSSGAKEANDALERLAALYGNSPFDEADVIVALGGDGLMLQTLHMTMKTPKPIYGMNRGSVGFLMNDYFEQGLPERLESRSPRSFIRSLCVLETFTGLIRLRGRSTRCLYYARPIRRPSCASRLTT